MRRAQDAAGGAPDASSRGPSTTLGAGAGAPSSSSQAGDAGAAAPAPEGTARDPEASESRVLGGHVFPVAAFVPTAFTVSSFGMRAGMENRTVPGFVTTWTQDQGPRRMRASLETISASEALEISLRLHRALALALDGYGRARVGANAPALLGTGAEFEYGGNFGALVRLVRAAPFQLALRLQGGYVGGQKAGFSRLFSDLLSLAQAAATRTLAGESELSQQLLRLEYAFSEVARSLLTRYQGGRAGGSLHAALALGRYVGVQAAFGAAWSRALYTATRFDAETEVSRAWRETMTTLHLSAAAAIDLDLTPAGVPLDLMLEYAPERTRREIVLLGKTTRELALEQRIALGLYYAGRSDLQLGLVGYFLFGQIPELGANTARSGRPRDAGAQFVFRYIW